MAQIYSLQRQQLLLLYTMDSHIYSRIVTAQKADLPALMQSDFANHLNSIMIDDTLFYVYLSKDNLLKLYSTYNYHNSVSLTEHSIPNGRVESILLTAHKEHPLLFYSVSESNTGLFTVCCTDPLSNTKFLQFPNSYTHNPLIHIFPSQNRLILSIYSEGNYNFYLMDNDFALHPLSHQADKSHEQIESLTHEIDRLNSTISSISSQYDDLMHVAQRYRDEALKWQNKFLYRNQK